MVQQELPRRLATLAAAALLATAPLAPAWAQTPAAKAAAEKPQYGGALSIANAYYTIAPLSFDSGDWPWKFNLDNSLVYEQLMVADLSKSKRKGGKHAFTADAWLPPDAIKGELAESWKLLDNPLRVEVQLRKGVMFPAKAGVMEARELVADDVVYSFERMNKSSKTHSGVHRQFHRLVQHEARIPKELRDFLVRAYDFKSIADYDTSPPPRISPARAAAAITTAELFLAAVTTLIPP